MHYLVLAILIVLALTLPSQAASTADSPFLNHLNSQQDSLIR